MIMDAIDALAVLDTLYLTHQCRIQSLNEQRNALSREIGQVCDKKSPEFAVLVARGKELAATLKVEEPIFAIIEAQWKAAMYLLPNLPHESVPEGKGPEDNVVIKMWEPPIRTPQEDHTYRLRVMYDWLAERAAGYGHTLESLVEWHRAGAEASS